ncbi:hypothetical protein [Hyphomicrobium sp. 2TAF46]|uniref:hypothetical protein n=1 Tax=Hyphomicrobium sp. 2TAF46 TaxID=3233019 RepID=UPI003F923E7C
MSGFNALMDGLAPFQHPFWVAVAVAFLGAAAVGIALAALAHFLETYVGTRSDAPSNLIDSDDAASRPLNRLSDYGRTRALAATAGRHVFDRCLYLRSL